MDGVRLMILGFFKKVYVADNLGVFTDQIYAMPSPGAWEVMAGFWTFGIQIYCDFSGYTDIARGCAKCLGLEFKLNFNYPYISRNMSEFWNRWHISLSSWLRDYLYFPLGGSRHGELKTWRNLAITMLLSGLWHGSTWNTVIWGGYMALILVAHRVLKPHLDALTWHKRIIPGWIRAGFNIFLTFNAFTFGFILFRSTTIEAAGVMFANLFNGLPSVDFTPWELVVPFLKFGLPLFVIEFVLYQLRTEKVRRLAVQPVALETIIYSIMFYLVVFYGATAQSFIYFQF
jgi:D-alanyl-lipoteichoic acid acyltransferase DltB (MBOAT superfamily)